jgi:Ca2+-dependent lipid-binding protein
MRQLESDSESVHWINHFMSRFWLIYEPVLSAQIIGQADAVLSENCPSFLDSIRLTTFTLGTKAPHIEFVKTYPRTEPNIVVSPKSMQLGSSQHDIDSLYCAFLLVYGLEGLFYTHRHHRHICP